MALNSLPGVELEREFFLLSLSMDISDLPFEKAAEGERGVLQRGRGQVRESGAHLSIHILIMIMHLCCTGI